MSQGIREDVLQGVRTWAKAAAGGLSDAEVVCAFDQRPKEAKPHLLVQELRHFGLVGQPERQRRRNGTKIEERVESTRFSTYQIDAFGIAALPWLEYLGASRWRSDIRTLLDDEQIDVKPNSDIQDTTAIVSNKYERRATQTWRADYQVQSGWYEISEQFSKLEFSGELRDTPDQSDADALDLDYTLTD